MIRWAQGLVINCTQIVLSSRFHPDGLAVTDANLPRVWVVGGGSIYPAVQNLLLACLAEGLGVCLQGSSVRLNAKLRKSWGFHSRGELWLPSRSAIRSCAGMARSQRRPVEEMAFIDSWDQPFT
jgi:nitroreductase